MFFNGDYTCFLDTVLCVIDCIGICDQVELTLTIHQEATSEPHKWNVAIENATPFVISDTKLDCKGFQSLTEIYPEVILIQDEFCIVNARRQMKPKDSLQFVYASEDQFPLKVV